MQEVTTTREGAGGRAGHGQRPRTEQRGAGGAAASRLSERRGPSDYLGTRTLRAPQINSHQPQMSESHPKAGTRPEQLRYNTLHRVLLARVAIAELGKEAFHAQLSRSDHVGIEQEDREI